jgi:hypothetical protein
MVKLYQYRKCEILDISQPYWPSWPATGIALSFILPCSTIEDIALENNLKTDSN